MDGLPQPPADQELRNIIDKLAQFVARNGPEFEQMTKTKQQNNPKFAFLFERGEHYHYYTYKVQTEQAICRGQQAPFYQQPPPRMPWRPPGGPPLVPPHVGPPLVSSPGTSLRPPRPLMEIQTYAPEASKLQEQLDALEAQKATLTEQISQSESNLAAQKKVTDERVGELAIEAVRKAKWEHLELLSGDTGISLDELESVLAPIIESCTKETIGTGKGWIFSKATSHDKNQMIAHYLAFRVTQDEAPFQLRLHLIYLLNDVLHHCVRKNAEELKQCLESVAVEMFCSGWTAARGDESKQAKLTKLIRLWEDKSIFSGSTTNKMRNADATWRDYQIQLKEDYATTIDMETRQATDTYNSYAGQHDAFVQHAKATIKTLDTQVANLQEEINRPKPEVVVEQPPPPVVVEEVKRPSRSSRWDTGSDGNLVPHHTPNFMIPSGIMMPDFSRPPPGFPGMGGPPPQPPAFDESTLIPSLPYFDLPAGLMVPLIKLEDSGYKPLDPKKLRLPPPTPPSDRLLAAVDQFYALPSHERPRDPEGWEMLGLYEWSREKTAAIKIKADDIEAGVRQRSPTASPDPYDTYRNAEKKEVEVEQTKVVEKQRKRYRSRSRTRSKSPESTPERRQRSFSRSPSPTGGYTLPSYLTKRSPSPEGGGKSPPVSSSRKRKTRRSPSPDSYVGFGQSGSGSNSASNSKLDSSNKGHQMMQKMGWKGCGLGSGESGITEPVSGGEVRDKTDKFRGVGHGADPFEAFRKSKAGSFYTRMKDRDKDAK